METKSSQTLLAIALYGALTTTIAQAQEAPSYYVPLTLAPVEPEAAGGSGAPDAVRSASGGGGDTGGAATLAMQLQNPLAALISVPIQNNFDFGAGPDGDGFQYLVRLQPVIPVSLSDRWNFISRTILPVIYQQNYIGTTSQSGLGDTIQNLFFSPKALYHGWTWGAGPVFQFPTATDGLLGSEKWAMGPTLVALKQEHGWTYGMLLNQFTSFAGNEGRQDVNYLFLQPFLAYTLKTHTTFSLNTESVYNWEDPQWTVPINLSIKQLVHIGKQPVQFEFGGRYYAEKPEFGPEWGLRFTVTFLFPKKD